MENDKNLNVNEKDILNRNPHSKSKTNSKGEKNVMRFSNLSKDTSYYIDEQSKPNQEVKLASNLL
jgi:hypothetical protein